MREPWELGLEVGSSVGRKGRRGIPREGAVLSIRKLFYVQEGKMGIHFEYLLHKITYAFSDQLLHTLT